MHEPLKYYLQQHSDLSEEKLDNVIRHFKEEHFQKNEIVVRENSVCKYLYFIKKGGLRIFCISNSGQEWTRYLALENEFITIMPSFIHKKPTTTYLQAFEPTELMAISYDDFYKLVNEIQEWECFYRKSLENIHVQSIKRIEEFITMDAKERYETCLQYRPEFVQRLSNKVLASYLGISQETLSRLKSK